MRIETRAHDQAGIGGVAAACLLLGGASRVVAQGLHGQGGLGPQATQDGSLLSQQNLSILADCDLAPRHGPAAAVHGAGKPMFREAGEDAPDLGLAHLHDRAQFLAE